MSSVTGFPECDAGDGRRKKCATPGCTLMDFHFGLCSSWAVPSRRARKPKRQFGDKLRRDDDDECCKAEEESVWLASMEPSPGEAHPIAAPRAAPSGPESARADDDEWSMVCRAGASVVVDPWGLADDFDGGKKKKEKAKAAAPRAVRAGPSYDVCKPWDPDEDILLREAIDRYGTKWSQVSKSLPGRTAAMARNRWARMRAGHTGGAQKKNRCTTCGQWKLGHTCTGKVPRAPLAAEEGGYSDQPESEESDVEDLWGSEESDSTAEPSIAAAEAPRAAVEALCAAAEASSAVAEASSAAAEASSAVAEASSAAAGAPPSADAKACAADPNEHAAFWSAVLALQGSRAPPAAAQPPDAAVSPPAAASLPPVAMASDRPPPCHCHGCVRDDCGQCVNCLDKARFGGSGKRKRKCVRRTCRLKTSQLSPGLPPPHLPWTPTPAADGVAADGSID